MYLVCVKISHHHSQLFLTYRRRLTWSGGQRSCFYIIQFEFESHLTHECFCYITSIVACSKCVTTDYGVWNNHITMNISTNYPIQFRFCIFTLWPFPIKISIKIDYILSGSEVCYLCVVLSENLLLNDKTRIWMSVNVSVNVENFNMRCKCVAD